MGKPRSFGMLVGLVAGYFAGWGLYHLFLIGSCSTPAGPGEVPCPPGSEQYFFAVFLGMFGGIGSIFVGGSWVSFMALFSGIGLAGVMAGLRPEGEKWFIFFGLCFLLTPVMGVVSLPFVGMKRLRMHRLLSQGIPAVGTVLAIADTGVMINNNPRVRLRFRIEPQHGVMPPYEAEKTATVSRVAIPRVGDRYPVWVDRDDPQKWMFGMGTPDATAPPSLRRVVELARQGAAPAVPPPAPPVDVVAQLNTLNELRLTGKIGPEEFAAKTGELLNRMPV
jgi:hypothetical protein